MKRKFLSLIIAFVLTCSGLVFVGCDNESGYNLDNLLKDYKNSIESMENVNCLTDYSIEFDYSIYVYDGENYLSQIINSTAPYSYLTSFYNPLFDNSMKFVYSYIDICSSNSINAPRDVRDEIKSDLDDFVVSLKKTSVAIDAVGDKLRKGNDVNSEDALMTLENLFNSYDELYKSSINFSNDLSKLYYDYAVVTSTNYANAELKDFDANNVVIHLNSRLNNHIANYTESYITMNILGSNLSNDFTDGSVADLPTNYTSYKNNINVVDDVVDDSLGNKINNSTQKERFYNASLALYNCLSVMENDYPLYEEAINSIVYLEVITDLNATQYEKTCANIIKNRAQVIENTNSVLTEMIQILGEIDG